MSKEQALRYNENKVQLSHILEADYAIEGVCEVLEFGAKKYDRSNYKKGFPKEQLIDSLLRHLTKYINGEELDSESNLHHLNHVLANSIFLAYHYNGKKEKFDEPLEEVTETPEPVVEEEETFPFYARIDFTGYDKDNVVYESEIKDVSNVINPDMRKYQGVIVEITEYVPCGGYSFEYDNNYGSWHLLPEWFTEVTAQDYYDQQEGYFDA